jgi:hypothetical protein
MFRRHVLATLVRFTAAIASLFLIPASAFAQSPFATLNGSWSGAGQIKLEGGSSESLKCKAYYTTKEDGAGLGLAIRCASASNKIELRANLNYASGKVTGDWEERQFNAAGRVTGQASSNRLNLSIEGGGVTGSMTVALDGGRHSVSIQTTGTGLKAVNINLSRS